MKCEMCNLDVSVLNKDNICSFCEYLIKLFYRIKDRINLQKFLVMTDITKGSNFTFFQKLLDELFGSCRTCIHFNGNTRCTERLATYTDCSYPYGVRLITFKNYNSDGCSFYSQKRNI